MTEPTKEFLGMIDEIQQWVGRRVDKEWDDLFGSAVLISVPRESDPTKGNVCGWVHPRESGKGAEALLMESLFTLCVTLMLAEDVDPTLLMQTVMSAAVHTDKGVVMTVGEPDDMPLN